MENYDANIIGAKLQKNPFYFNICNSFKIILYEFLPFTYDEMENILKMF